MAEERGGIWLELYEDKVPLSENVKHLNSLGSMTDFRTTQYPDKIQQRTVQDSAIGDETH